MCAAGERTPGMLGRVAGPNLGFHAILPLIASRFEVVSRLHIQPVFRRGPEISSQAQGSLRGDCALSGDDRTDTVGGDVNFLGEPVHADAQVIQSLFENVARMNGRQLIGSVS